MRTLPRDLVRVEIQTARDDVFVLGISSATGYRLGESIDDSEEYSPDVEWVHIADSADDIAYRMGFTDGNGIGVQLEAGQLDLTIADWQFDPLTNPYMRRGTAIRLLGLDGVDWTPVFTGTIANVSNTYVMVNGRLEPRIAVRSDDCVPVLSNLTKVGSVAGSFANRIDDIMSITTVDYTVDGGTATFASNEESISVIEHLQLAQDTEQGFIWVDRNNHLKAYGKGALPDPITAPLFVFQNSLSPSVGYVTVTDMETINDTSNMFNDVTVKNITGADTEDVGPFRNYTSVASYGSSRLEVTTNLANTAAAEAYGNALLDNYDEASLRITSISFNALDFPEAAIRLNVMDPVQVVLANENIGIEQNLRVMSISGRITPFAWDITVGLIDTKEV